jgi:hypothetical protein
MKASGRRSARALWTRMRRRTRISKPYCYRSFLFTTVIPADKLNANLFRVAADGDTEDNAGGTGQKTSAAGPTTAPTPSNLSSGSAVAGGVATNPRHAPRRARRVAPRLRPA